MQANQLDAMAREKLTKLVNSRVRPWIWILVVFSLVVLAEYLIFSRSQYVASDPTLCECKSVKPKQARILNGIAVPKDDLRWVASIYTIKPHKQKPGKAVVCFKKRDHTISGPLAQRSWPPVAL